MIWPDVLVNGFKDVENRTWRTKYRGRLYIHASGTYTRRAHDEWKNLIPHLYGTGLPFDYCELETGGIIGSVELDDVADDSNSVWFDRGENKAWLVSGAKTMEIVPCKGRLQVWEFDLEGAMA